MVRREKKETGRMQLPLTEIKKPIDRTDLEGKSKSSILDILSLRCF